MKPYALGALAPKHDRRNLHFASYVHSSKFKPRFNIPSSFDWSLTLKEYPYFKNDSVGCCVFSTLANAIHVWTSNKLTGPHIVPDSAVIDAYKYVTRNYGNEYNPLVPESDTGAALLDAVNYARNIGINNRKVYGYIQVDHRNEIYTRAATWIFGGIMCRVDLPLSAIDQVDRGLPWSVPTTGSNRGIGKKGGRGGHAVWLTGYVDGMYRVRTWDTMINATPSFISEYVDEQYALASDKEWASDGTTPSGFNWDQMIEDMYQLRYK